MEEERVNAALAKLEMGPWMEGTYRRAAVPAAV